MTGTAKALAAIAAAAIAALPLGAAARTAQGQTASARPRLYHVDIGVPTSISTLVVNKFVPDHLTIHAGDSVEWTNAVPAEPQTVTFGPLELIPPLAVRGDVFEVNPQVARPRGGRVVGDTSSNLYSSGALMNGIRGVPNHYTFTFRTPGTYIYRSLFHPNAIGELDVVPASRPASPTTPNDAPTLVDALRSTSQVLYSEQGSERNGASTSAGATVDVGEGDGNISINKFTPAGVTIHAGSSVTWRVLETSGDPHVLVFNPTSADSPGGQEVRMYLGLKPSGALRFNPAYANPTMIQSQTVTTSTLDAVHGRIVSTILYGSSINAQALTDTSYSLTFAAPGIYTYIDPFHHGMAGTITVSP